MGTSGSHMGSLPGSHKGELPPAGPNDTVLLGDQHPAGLSEAEEESGGEHKAQHFCLPLLQEQDLGFAIDEGAAFTSCGVCRQKAVVSKPKKGYRWCKRTMR